MKNESSVKKRTVENRDVYLDMQERGSVKYSFGVLMHINDREWHEGVGFGNGTIIEVFTNYEDALKKRRVYPHHDEDYLDDFFTDETFEITIFRLNEKFRLLVEVSSQAEPIFDVYSPRDLVQYYAKYVM
jgi:hypothetical protein